MESGQEVRFASKSPGDGEAAPVSLPPRAGTPLGGGGGRSRGHSPSSQAHKRLIDDVRISILREQMEHLEAERARIIEESRQVKAENQERLQDQADIYYYLNKKLDSYYEMINKLEEMIVREQSEREAVEKDYERTIEKLNAKISSDELKASSKIAELEDKLELSRKFYEQKPVLEAEIADLKVQLSECQEAGRRTSDDWEKRLVLEKRRLREEMEARMDALRASHAEEIERKLSLKTKKTKIANVLYRRELLHQTKQAEDITEKDRELYEQDRKLRAELAWHRDLLKEMENKLTAYRKTVKSLTDQLDAKIIPRAEDSIDFKEISEKYSMKCVEHEQLRLKYNDLLELYNSDVSKYGSLWALVMQFYRTMKRGLRKPMSDVEITEDPDRFVMEVVLGALEKHPARFRRAMRKHFSDQSLSVQLDPPKPETISFENSGSVFEASTAEGGSSTAHRPTDSKISAAAGTALAEEESAIEASSKWWTTATMDFAARSSLSPPKVEPPKPSGTHMKLPLASARGRNKAVSSAIAGTRSAPMLSLSQYQARIRDRKQKEISGLGWELLAPEPPLPLHTPTTTEARNGIQSAKLKASTRSRDPVSRAESNERMTSGPSIINDVVHLSDDDFINQALESRSVAHSVSTPFSYRASLLDPSSHEELSSSMLVTRVFTPTARNTQVSPKSYDESALELQSSVFGEGSNVLAPHQVGMMESDSLLPGTGNASIESLDVGLGIDKGFSVDRGLGLGGSKTNTLSQGGGGPSTRLYHSVIGGSNLKSRRGVVSSSLSGSQRLRPIVRGPPRTRGQSGIHMEMSVAKISLTSPPKNKK